MKKILRIMVLSVAGIFLLKASAFATILSYGDIYKNWPGQVVTHGADQDENGTPMITGADVEVSGDAANPGQLKSITIHMSNRRVWDSLFISTGGPWDSWDYIVYDSDNGNNSSHDKYDKQAPAADGLYFVSSGYSYEYVDHPYGRTGHANGINADHLSLFSSSFEPVWDSFAGTLTYDFSNMNINLDADFAVGYTPWCANDVFVTPVPEPATMLLLGIGMLGIACVNRRQFFRRI